MHDIVIRGGTIVDGTGTAAFTGDVAIDGDRIVEIGRVSTGARRTIDADGAMVTPGWVDIHTHFDGQVAWDPLLTPSSWHGVTTVVMGNCGVGFAPVLPGREKWLIGLMEGVEDIPGDALAAGIPWGWETFAEYLDVLEQMPRAIDVGGHLAHGALRAYVMGDRGARNEEPTEADLGAMDRLTREALAAGALGVSTSRTLVHRSVDGEVVPGTYADHRELQVLARACAASPGAVFEVVPLGVVGEDVDGLRRDIELIMKLGVEERCAITYLMLQPSNDPDGWRSMLASTRAATALGANVRPQTAGRAVMVLFGHQTKRHPFDHLPSYEALAALPLAERVGRLRDPEVKARLLAEKARYGAGSEMLAFQAERSFAIGNPPDYEPAPERSVAAIAARLGRSTDEVFYDLMLDDDGRELFMYPTLNYASGSADEIREMLLDPLTVLGGSDAGAHCGVVCDASAPTSNLTHWVRDRSRGERLPLELMVRRQTQDTALMYGLRDRGVVGVGYRADVNVIDWDRLNVDRPVMTWDLPAGARRLVQRATGYLSTIAHGQSIVEGGEDTGARPGQILRRGERG